MQALLGGILEGRKPLFLFLPHPKIPLILPFVKGEVYFPLFQRGINEDLIIRLLRLARNDMTGGGLGGWDYQIRPKR